jgi:hypothetical protein
MSDSDKKEQLLDLKTIDGDMSSLNKNSKAVVCNCGCQTRIGYKYLLKNDMKNKNVIHHKMPEIVTGFVSSKSRLKAMIFLIKLNPDIRMYLHFRYYLDCSELDDIFCDLFSENEKIRNKYYTYLEDNDIENEEDEDHIGYLNELKDSPNFTNSEKDILEKYYKDKIKYRNLIGCFWGRDFLDGYTKLSDDDFECLAKAIFIDNNIKFIEV